jgi:5-hydroxyisourate hydrolase
MSLSTHVLDAASGRPARDVPLRLSRVDAQGDVELTGSTDDDGRYRFPAAEVGGADLSAGVYRLTFDTGAYFAATGQVGFYPEVSVTFEITDAGAHHHVPLLLSPFAFSTYRGS